MEESMFFLNLLIIFSYVFSSKKRMSGRCFMDHVSPALFLKDNVFFLNSNCFMLFCSFFYYYRVLFEAPYSEEYTIPDTGSGVSEQYAISTQMSKLQELASLMPYLYFHDFW